MRFSIAIALASAAVVSAANFTVTVGANNMLAFNPTNVIAAVGDTIDFQFHAKNHSVTQSTFANPCKLMTTPKQGIDSGYQPVAVNATQFPTWSITIDNATAPLWFYCKQGNHCPSGMVFAVNPTPNASFAAFQAAAMASGSSATNSASSTALSATVPASASSGAPSTTSTSARSGALRVSGSAASILAVVGLIAGLVL